MQKMQGNNIMPRLKEKYQKEAIPFFLEKYNTKNILRVPRIEKVVLNTSLSKAVEEPKFLEKVSKAISDISGQKPILTKAKKSISAFKLREGMKIGVKVTLRGKRMYEFLDRLISVTLPRVRDFRGLDNKSFDGKGNYTFGISEITFFPETASLEDNFSLEITVVTSAKQDEEAKDILEKIGFPFKKAVKKESK